MLEQKKYICYNLLKIMFFVKVGIDMEYIGLYELIKSLEYGTKIHIGVVFLDDYGNQKTILPLSQCIHSKSICNFFKNFNNGQKRCIRCRNTALKKAIKDKRSFGGICINGIYEYCHPVVMDDAVVCVIFVGNILPDNRGRLLDKIPNNDLLKTLEADFSAEQCEKISRILDSYIRFLFKEYSRKIPTDFNPLIENIKNYIEENLMYDFKVSDFSKVFNYNEKYLGKLFKAKTGNSIKEYINLRRIEIAEKMLKKTSFSITDISLKVGFNNVTYFNRIFKKLKGKTPSEYRYITVK